MDKIADLALEAFGDTTKNEAESNLKLQMSVLESLSFTIREFSSPRYPDIEKPKVSRNAKFGQF